MISQSLLLERLLYRGLLTEASRFEFLLKTYGPKVAKKIETTVNPVNVVHDIDSIQGDSPESKVIQYILAHDPSNNQQYAQWMVNCWLRGGMMLEDLERAKYYLEVFTQARSRIEKRDINAYKTLPELFVVVQPFIKGEIAVSANAEMDKEARDMHAQAQIVFDDPEFKIVIPRTQAASCYFGKNTQWCTAATRGYNYFDDYNRRGPLYIILDKKNNRRWQFHFEPKAHGYGSFMDENDHSIDVPKFIEAYPKVVTAIGRTNFAPFLLQAGLKNLTPEEIAELSPRTVGLHVKSKTDLKHVPKPMLKEYEFIHGVFDGSHNYTAAAKVLGAALYGPFVPQLLSDAPYAFSDLHDEFKTTKNAAICAQKFNYNHIKADIPETLWNAEITDLYWSKRIDGDYTLHLDAIPKKYRNPATVLISFKRHLEDMTKHPEALTHDIVDALLIHHINTVKFLPLKYLTSTLCDMITSKYKDAHISPNPMSFLSRFPEGAWNTDAVLYLVGMRKMDFKKLPERFRHNEQVMVKLIEASTTNLRAIPKEYLPDSLLRKVITSYGVIGRLDPAVLNDSLILHALKSNGRYSARSYYEELPKSKRSPAVMTKFMECGVVPVAQMPKALITPELVIARVGDHPDEGAQIPKKYWNEDFAEKLVNTSFKLAEFVPANLRTTRVLRALMNFKDFSYHYEGHRGAHRAIFDTFPKSAWDPKIVALAVHHGYLEPTFESVPAKLMSAEAAVNIVGMDIDQWDKLPKNFHTEKFYAEAVDRNSSLLEKLSREQMTEPVCFAALSHMTYRHHTAPFQVLPRENFIERDWERAVGYINSIKDVPAKYRTPAVVKAAIDRDPKELLLIKDPAAYVTKHKISLSRSKYRDPELETYGLLFKKDGEAVSVNKLPREKVAEGVEVAMIKAKTNFRLYLFVNNKYVVRFFTNQGDLEMPTPVEQAKKYRDQIMMVAQAGFFKDTDPVGLNKVHIYKHGGEYKMEAALNREALGNLEWSSPKHGEGKLFTAWVGKKPILRLERVVTSGRFGRGSRVEIGSVNVLDHDKCVRRSKDIAAYMTKHSLTEGRVHGLYKLGVMLKENKAFSIRDRSIVHEDKLSVWDGGGYLSVWDGSELLAHVLLKVNGTYNARSINYAGHYYAKDAPEELSEKITSLLDKGCIALKPEATSKIEIAKAHRKEQQKAKRDEKRLTERRREELLALTLPIRERFSFGTEEELRDKIDRMNLQQLESNLGSIQRRLQDDAAAEE